MVPYKINCSGNNNNWREKSVCEFGISPGHECHDGDKLASLLYWADKNFDRIVLTLSDSLYRYNFMADGMSEKDAYQEGLKIGTQWLFRNQSVLKEYESVIDDIHHWDKWLAHKDFNDLHKKVIAYYHEDIGFKDALDSDVARFIQRKLNQNTGIDPQIIKDNSRDFLLEEAAVYILIGRTLNPARVYPAKDINSFDYLRHPNTPDALKGFEMAPHVAVILNRKKSAFKKAA